MIPENFIGVIFGTSAIFFVMSYQQIDAFEVNNSFTGIAETNFCIHRAFR